MSEAPARTRLALASGSPRRLALLQQIGLNPDALLPADLDETPGRNESPRKLAARLALEKAQSGAKLARARPDLSPCYIVGADTVVCVGRRILPKCETLDEADDCLRLLSGRAHRVFTGVTVIDPQGRDRSRLVEARLRFKRLSSREMEAYLASREWAGKAGGYAIQGIAGGFVVKLVGSYSAVVGLPLYETRAMLDGLGYPTDASWATGAPP
ncbi:septum formation protein Maf [Rhodoblastus sphagnicola]|uniref:dTTP/UTP pyrophosphatase n=1 Tax=Rhodoblastus sphagnicola TaxID=333368 RepID=A0A2S6MXN5_9HYPH|nr:Maf family nucleotide pyrophosphatase [Rhodoblastus sphagnicola]MBB4196776.1 septum formation protein [Rhodoblastus sphagnicola]PPQ27127.1 septum formation protein Maf [Rhodoblastus sphagnicola]